MQLDFQEFFEQVAAVAGEGLAKAHGAAEVARMMGGVTSLAEATLSGHLDPEQGKGIACRAGCAHCCVVNVATLLPEAIAIGEYVARTIPLEERARLRQRLADLNSRIRWVDDEERVRLRLPCAFLDSRGWCMVHPVRPLSCRALTSTDSGQCRRAMETAGTDYEEPIMVNLFQKFLMDTAFRGAAAALDQRRLDSRSWPLATAVHHFLARPELVGQFLSGERMRLDE